jgi:hypothetical protein
VIPVLRGLPERLGRSRKPGPSINAIIDIPTL